MKLKIELTRSKMKKIPFPKVREEEQKQYSKQV